MQLSYILYTLTLQQYLAQFLAQKKKKKKYRSKWCGEIIMGSFPYGVFGLLALKGMHLLSVGLKPMKFVIYHTFWKVSRNHAMVICTTLRVSCYNMTFFFFFRKKACFNISGM